MLGTLPLSLRPSGAITQGQPRLDPNDPINVGVRALFLLGRTNYDIANKQQPLTTSTPPNNAPSVFGNVAKFNGSSQFINIPFSASLLPNVGSWCFWLNVTSAVVSGNYTTFFSQGYDGSTQPIYFDCRGSGPAPGTNLAFQSFSGGPVQGVTSSLDLSLSANLNKWFFVVGAYDGANFKIYINGVLNASVSGTLTAPNAKEFNIGYLDLNGSGARFAPSYIWGVRVLNRVLLPSEILQLYTDPFAGLIFPSDFDIGMFGGASTPVASPFFVPNFDLRPNIKINPDLRSFTDDRVINLIGSDSIYSDPGQAPSYELKTAPRAPTRKDHVKTTDIQLIGQDTFFGVPGQTKVYDYPNPILRKDDVTKRTWIASLVYGISTTIVLAQQAWNWNKNTYSLIFNYNLTQKAWQWVPNSSIIQYTISLVTKAWQWKGQSPIFSGGNFNKVKKVIQAFMVSINRFMNR